MGETTHEDSSIAAFDMDGIFGLAFEGVAAVTKPSSLSVLREQHPELVAGFSMYLSSDPSDTNKMSFITFGGYAIYRRLTLQPQPSESKPIYWDGLAVALGLVVYGLFYYFHEALSGVGLS